MRNVAAILHHMVLLYAAGAGMAFAEAGRGPDVQAAAVRESGRAIPIDQLGVEAQKQYAGDGISITPTAAGAKLRAVMQDLEGEVTREGLWLTSTADEDAGKPNRFRVRAMEVGRGESAVNGQGSMVLPPTGTAHVTKDAASFVRPGLIEEYTVSTDGVRQDFVVLERPAGLDGTLSVALDVTGARAEAASYGAKLTVTATGRELAYSRLRVTDATGKNLIASMKVDAADRLRVEVEDMGAVYPVRIDPTFSDANWISMGGLPGTDGTVKAMVFDESGNLYLAGNFSIVGEVLAENVAKWNGSAWSALGSGVSDEVKALAWNNGALYVGGLFATAGDVTANNIAKWDGGTWSALGSGTNYTIYALAVIGGDLYAAGDFFTAGGVSANHLAKWDGSVWSAVGTGMNSNVSALAVSGTDLYAGGGFTTAGGVSANRIAKWNGSVWSAVGTGMNGDVNALAVSGTDLYAGGNFTTAGGVSANRIAKWNGSAWSVLGTGMNSNVFALAVSGTDLYVGGNFIAAGGVSAGRIAKWNGSVWSAVGTGMNGDVNALAMSGADLYAGGNFSTVSAVRIAKWNGSAWSALGTGMSGNASTSVSALAVSGTDLYVGGGFTSAGGVSAICVAKWNGSAWSVLGTGMNSNVFALAVSGTNLYAGGNFTTAGGVSANRIAKWDGSAWSALGTGMNSHVHALAVSGTDLYAGGGFTTAGGVSAIRIAKWDGSAWSALGTGMNSEVNALAVSGTDLYAGGYFTTAGGVSANYVAKWNGSAWSALGTGLDSFVHALAVSGTDLYAGGAFFTAGVVIVKYIAKWNGSAWSALGTGMNSHVHALAASGTDLYAGGDFTTAGGVSANRIAKWNGNGWSALGSGMNNWVDALAVSGTNLYAGGSFTTAGGRVSAYIVRADLSSLAPAAVLGSASNISSSGATLNATVNANGLATQAQFEYGLTAAYGSTTTAVLSPDNADSNQAVSATLSSLIPSTTYHYRLVAVNADGTCTTGDGIFVTRSNNADLANLVFSASPLSPTFSSITTSYTASVSNATTSITVTPTVAETNATVKVNGVTVASGSASGLIALVAGDNVITTVVTAQDGTTTKTYTLTVNRPLGATFTSSTTPIVTTNGFTASGTVDLALAFAPPTGTALMVVKNTGLGFISGTFSNLAQGQAVDLIYDGVTYKFVANYYGGSGNDLVLVWADTRVMTWGFNLYGQLGNNSSFPSSVPVAVGTAGVLSGKTVLSVATGRYHTVALCSDGTVATWGRNEYGQLGNNSTTDSSVPIAVDMTGVLSGKTVIAVAAGTDHNLALCSDGTLVAWGHNTRGELGNNSTTDSSVPVAVDRTGVLFGKSIVGLGAGTYLSMVLCSDGTVGSWGENGDGQLGNNSSTESHVPVLVNTAGVLSGKTVVALAVGSSHTLALCSDGTVAAWGENFYGQLGNNSTIDSSVPVAVNMGGVLSGKTVTAVAAGTYHSLVACSDGNVAAWGCNSSGQLGDGTISSTSPYSKLLPVLVYKTGVLLGKTVTALAAGGAHSIVLCPDGVLVSWGENSNGSLGNGSGTDRPFPGAVSTATLPPGGVFAMLASCHLAEHSASLVSVGPPSSNADLSALALGTGTLSPSFSASTTSYTADVSNTTTGLVVTLSMAQGNATVKVNDVTVGSGNASGAISLSVGSNVITTVVTAQDGTTTKTYTIIVTRLSNDANLAGLVPSVGTLSPSFSASTTSYSASVPSDTTSITVTPTVAQANATVKVNNVAVASGNASGAINLNYGANIITVKVTAQDGTTTKTYTLMVNRVVIAAFTSATDVPVTSNGFNASGGTVNLSLAYAPATGATLMVVKNTGLGFISGTFSNLAQGQAVALAYNGATYNFVANYYGGTGNDLLLVWADTRAMAWGENSRGQLGNNSNSGSTVPMTVSTAGVLAGKTILSVDTGWLHTVALCSDGTVATWGENSDGQLGNGSNTDSSVPVAVNTTGVLSGKTVVAVAAGYFHCLVLCSDGTMASWGDNSRGQLGINNTTSSSVPVAVNLSGVLFGKSVVGITGGSDFSVARCSDGTVAAWGANTRGSLGNNSFTDSHVPVRVSTAGVLAGKTVVSIAGGAGSTVALCSDGTLVSWGYNVHGQLGDNSTINRSVPVAVVTTGVLSGKTVTAISAGISHSLVACSDGTLAGWGDNFHGQLGNGTFFTTSSVPVAVNISGVLSGKTVTLLAAGGDHSLALCSDGFLAAWGDNLGGELGNNSTTDRNVPVAVSTTTLPSGVVFAMQATGHLASHSVGLVSVGHLSTNADLAGIASSAGSLTPAFASGTTSYTASVSNATTSITVTPTAADPNSTIKVNDVTVGSGNASGAISLSVGSNVITTVVTAQDGTTTKSYTLTVTRVSNDANLAGLVPSVGTLSPAFSASTTSYTVSVSNATTSITVTSTVAQADATVKVNNVTVVSGSASGAINLSVGSNVITAVVTAQDGTITKTYTLIVSRSPSSDANLAGLVSSVGTLSPSFSSSTTSYTASVSNATTSITVTPTVAQPNATVKINNVTVASGSASGTVNLSVGSNVIATVVTAQDGTTTKTYSLTINRAPGNVSNTLLHSIIGAPAGATSDQLGLATSLSGSLLAVGVNDSTASDAGKVYVFDLSGPSPTVPIATLINPGPKAGDGFGFSISISGNLVAVGANLDDTTHGNAGSVYVYDLNSADPSVAVYTLHSPAADSISFGFAVSLSGTRLVAGSNFENVSGQTSAGRAYVFELAGATPTVPIYTLNNPNPVAGDRFGRAVAMSGMRVAVGAYLEDTGAVDSGIVYVYDTSSGTPTVPIATLKKASPQTGDWFGRTLAMSGTRVAVGVFNDNAGGGDAGSVYVYDVSGGTPTLTTLNNPSPSANDLFGVDVAISGTRVVVGVNRDDSSGPTDAGIAYMYDLLSATPTVPVATLNNPTPDTDDEFGYSVTIDGYTVAVGAPLDDSISTDQGAVYVFGPTTEIAVEQPVGTVLDDGNASIAFGGVATGASSTPVVVTVKNFGSANLVLGPITKDGSEAGEFTVNTAGMAVTVPPSSATSFTVTFTPTGTGTRNAAIHISCNDENENPFDINLTGTALNRPSVSDSTDAATDEDTPTGALSFTVGDVETPAGSLSVSASSSNTTLVPNANIVFGGSGANRTVTITPAANQNGAATITVTVSDGTLTANDTFTLTVNPVNDPPTISDIPNTATDEDTSTGTIALTVGDVETPAGSLSVSASSSNTTLVPNANIVFGGSGANRTVTVTPAANQNGAATITITVSDGTLTASDSFTFTAGVVNDAPSISDIGNTAITENTASPALAFDVSDLETEVSFLTVSGSSSNPTLVPNANIVFGGQGANRTVKVTPVPNQNGTTLISVTVTDGVLSATDTFALVVNPSGTLALGATLIHVAEEVAGGVVNIPIVRTGGMSGDATVQISTSDGKAVAGAPPSGDFTGKTNAVVNMPAGVHSVNVPITVHNPAGTNEPNETFTVTISNATVAHLGTPATATVRIIDSLDPSAPLAPIITNPASGVLKLDTATFDVIGTAGDNKGVASVKVKLNGGGFVDAALTTPGTTSTSWALTITPLNGANTITVQSFDTRGNESAIVTRTFTVWRPLAVQLAGTGIGNVTSGFAGTTYREVGKSFTITATATAPLTPTIANPGSVFTGWMVDDLPGLNQAQTLAKIGVAASSLTKATLTFAFREGLKLTARFEKNPYPLMAGTYNGLVHASPTQPPGGTAKTASTEGFFTTTVDSKGGFSGKLTIDGVVLSVIGIFDETGTARFGTARATTLTVPRLNKPSLTVGPLHVVDTDGAGVPGGLQIDGPVTASDFRRSVVTGVSNLLAERAFYGASQAVTGNITFGSVIITHLFTTVDRTPGELVTGTGIPAGAKVVSVDSANEEITLDKNATATRTEVSLTFTRNVAAGYLGAASAEGTYTVVLPARAPHYEVPVTFDGDEDTVDAGADNPFQDNAVVVFKGTLPSPLVAGQVYYVINKSDSTFGLSLSQGGGAMDIEASGSAVVVLDPDTRQIEGFTAKDFPQGDGVATIKVSKAGLVTLAGTLADGAAVSASSTLSSAHTVPLFGQLYLPNGLGFLSTLVKLKDLPLNNTDADLQPATNSEVLWLRPAMLDQYYPDGWPGLLKVDLMGAKYDAVVAGGVLRRANNTPLAAADLALGNATLFFSDGQLSGNVVKTVSISPTNVVTKVPDSADATFSLKLTPATGAIGGSFIHTDDNATAFQGIIFQKGPNAGAYGFFKTKAPIVIDYTGESGGVSLLGK